MRGRCSRRLLSASSLLLLIAALSIITPGRNSSSSAAEGASLQGDVNCDATVNSVDSLQILRSVAGLGTPGACLADAGDVNCDSAINSVDSLRILRHVAGLSNTAPDGCAPIGDSLGEPEPEPPTSIELIDAALARGDIDEEAAHMYRVFATFADDRLPAEHRGADRGVEPMEAMEGAAMAHDSFSAETKAAIDPYFTRPDEPGSWVVSPTVEPQGQAASAVVTWQKYSAVGGKVKVWAQSRYDGDAAKAEALASEITSRIWPKLFGVMGREPVSDAGLNNNGGDGAIDIYLVHAPRNEDGTRAFLGVALPSVPVGSGAWGGTCGMQRYINVDSTVPLGSETSSGMLQTVAHELFHAFQFAFSLKTGCWTPEYAWFLEASATWVEEYVYPKAQSEHVWLKEFLTLPSNPIDSVAGTREYGAYLWPWYMAGTGSPAYIRDSWTAFGNKLSLEAIEGVMSPYGGFDKQWPLFAQYNWNREPVDDYDRADQIREGAFPFGGKTTVGIEEVEMNLDIPYLSAQYRHFTFKEGVKSVIFENTVAQDANPHSAVWGIEKINGKWEDPEDWSEESRPAWCRDRPEEDIDELVIIFTDSDWQGKQPLKPANPPRLTGKGVGCQAWEGSVTSTYRNGPLTDTLAAKNIRFELDPDLPTPLPWEPLRYVSVAGSVDWARDVVGGGDGCVTHVTGSFAVGDSGSMMILDDGGERLSYGITTSIPLDAPTGPGTIVCPEETFDYPLNPRSVFYGWYENELHEDYRVEIDGITIAGGYTIEYGAGGARTWSWEFHAVP